MKNPNQENLEKAFALLESGENLEKVLAMFPSEKEAIQEISELINSLQGEKETVQAPKEILEKIFIDNELLSEEPGRFSTFEALKNLISNLITMNQKLKFAISGLGIILILVVGAVLFSASKNNSQITTKQKTKSTNETKLVTTSAVIGDKETDASINTTINEVLSDDDLDAEFSDIDLALSDETEIDQINNLFNDNEL